VSATAGAPDADLERRLIALRRAGKSYAAMARELNLARPRDATNAFIRAVRHAAPTDRTVLCDEELARLTKLEQRIRANEDLAPFDRDRQLDVISHLRERLQAP
jgi:hypothetical protein